MKTISDHILDILENSVRASASLTEVIITENKIDDLYTVEIRDNGTGMTKETAVKAMDPFFTSRTTRKVGLGLPLLKQNAERTGGKLVLQTVEGKGTVVRAEFSLGNIDRPSLGDIAGVFILFVMGHGNTGIIYKHFTGKGSFEISSSDLKETLGNIQLNSAEVRQAVRELIINNLELIEASQ